MADLWREIPGWEGFYEVSRNGEIRSMKRRVIGPRGFPQFRKAMPRRTEVNRGGYVQVGLSKAGKAKNLNVHSLVALAFIGPKPEGCVVMHLDNDRQNNSVENLRYGSYSENNAMKAEHGTALSGSKNHQAKLTPEQVEEIKQCPRGQIQPLCRSLEISYSQAKRIRRGLSWTA